MCPFDSIVPSGVEVDTVAFGHFWNVFLLFYCVMYKIISLLFFKRVLWPEITAQSVYFTHILVNPHCSKGFLRVNCFFLQ